jgi:guanosine-3',5'-bis(diphosphate) 3'-pyrophosphohydrolase
MSTPAVPSPQVDPTAQSSVAQPLAAPLPTLETLLEAARGYLRDEACATIADAYHFAAEAHEGMRRKSGEPYITHPLTTAIILAGMRMDPTTIVAGLLHDTVEDTAATLADVEARFGHAASHLVDGVTKVGAFGAQQIEMTEQRQSEAERERDKGRRGDGQQRRQAENVKKMFMAMAEDPRVIIVKLADRLHNMSTLDALPPQKQQRKALETREIYAPLAGRLGMAQMKWQLEDLAFKYLESDAYWWLVEQIAEQRPARERYARATAEALRGELAAHGVAGDVKGRAKHLYSIYRKLLRPEINMDLQRVYDLFALRVLVDTLPECYQALGQVHALWTPVTGRFKDYIATPKPNGYQSLHTTVIGPDGRQLEVQIRTHEMHRLAEYGVAAHLHYKEEGSAKAAPTSMTTWIETLMSWQDELQADSAEFMDSLKIDVFQDQVFVFSPKGDIIDLPAKSTPVDFAYRIHTELGNRTIGAKVNGRMVSLDTPLQNGERVEILTTRTPHGPSRDWAAFVASAGARAKIRAWFKRQDRDKNIAEGRELFERELQRLEQRSLNSLSAEQLEKLAAGMEFKTPDDLFAAIGYGALGPQQVVGRLKLRDDTPAMPEFPAVAPPPAKGASSGQVSVMGVGDLLTRLAPCCHPAPGDDIVGYITRNRGVTVHRASCPRILSEQETERLVRVEWGPAVAQTAYTVAIVVNAWDREGLLRDITTAIAEERVSITAASTLTGDHNATIRVTMRVSSTEQLSKVFSHIERVRGVTDVSRENTSARKANTA